MDELSRLPITAAQMSGAHVQNTYQPESATSLRLPINRRIAMNADMMLTTRLPRLWGSDH
ncbi:MAG: hypothetical protein MUC36_14350 [Planctomycetes bacterium]|nr:hypothetical protein [Planctomycetota bacterium]